MGEKQPFSLLCCFWSVYLSLIATGMKIQQEGSGVGMPPKSGGQSKKGKLGDWDLELLSWFICSTLHVLSRRQQSKRSSWPLSQELERAWEQKFMKACFICPPKKDFSSIYFFLSV